MTARANAGGITPPGQPPLSAETVRAWFIDADASQRRLVPSLELCASVGSQIIRIMSLPPGGFQVAPDPHETPGVALKYARLLLKHLPLEADRIELLSVNLVKSTDGITRQAGYSLKNSAGLLRGSDDIIKNLIEIMENTDVRRPFRIIWRYQARLISVTAQEAWLNAGNRPPHSQNANDPLNVFVQLALAHFEGVERPGESIADALKPPRRSGASVPKRPSGKRPATSP
jgi:hypothetical protein